MSRSWGGVAAVVMGLASLSAVGRVQCISNLWSQSMYEYGTLGTTTGYWRLDGAALYAVPGSGAQVGLATGSGDLAWDDAASALAAGGCGSTGNWGVPRVVVMDVGDYNMFLSGVCDGRGDYNMLLSGVSVVKELQDFEGYFLDALLIVSAFLGLVIGYRMTKRKGDL